MLIFSQALLKYNHQHERHRGGMNSPIDVASSEL